MARDLADELQRLIGDRFILERELQQGGMSRLFLAREPMLDSRRVVIKTLPPELASRVSHRRFVDEIQTMARLQHPRILPVLTADRQGRLAYYVTPYIEGESLRQRLARPERMDIGEILRLLGEIADAVGYGHLNGVIHRDVKPGNVLLSPGGAVVADFGIARVLGAAPSDSRLTTGPLGTAGYMPPEPDADERGDVFALGVLGSELLTGHRFGAGAHADAIVAQWSRPSELRRSRGDLRLVRALAAALEKALAEDPARRYRTAIEFGDAIAVVAARAAHASRRQLVGNVAMTGVAILAVVGFAAAYSTRDPAPKVAANLLAVAPFDVRDTALQTWHEGVTDALWRTLDGAGQVRVLSPTITIRQWGQGRADIESAVALGTATQARFVLVGTISQTGQIARIRATLVDVLTRSKVNEFEVKDSIQAFARAVDRLSLAVMQDSRLAGPAAVHVALDTLTNLTALKFFLQSEEAYRHNQLDSALTAAQRAIREDASFALPYYRIRTVMRATRGENDDSSFTYALLADDRNHRLGRHDSLLIAGIGWTARLRRATPRSREWWQANVKRFAALEQLVAYYPEDAEAWYELGEAREHAWSWTGIPAQSALDAFEKAIGHDSAFAPAYYHAIELRAFLSNGKEAAALARRYPTTAQPRDALARARQTEMMLISRLAVADSTTAERLCGASDAALTLSHRSEAAYVLRLMPDAAEAALHCYRGLERQFNSAWVADSEGIRSDEIWTRLSRGHPMQAAEYSSPTVGRSPRFFQEMALLRALPESVVLRQVNAWRDGRDGLRLALAIPIYRSRGDVTSLRRVIAQARDAESRSRTDRDSAFAVYAEASSNASIALLARDTTLAIERLAAAADSVCGWNCTPDRILLATLMLNSGKGVEAGNRLDRWPPPVEALGAMGAMWHLVRGRIFEQAGPQYRDEAAAHYAVTSVAWAHADSLAIGCLEAAKAGIARTRTGGTVPGTIGQNSHWPDVSSLACSLDARRIAAAR
jgi:TolB-like protein